MRTRCRSALVGCVMLAAAAAPAAAVNVLVLSSASQPVDDAVVAALQSRGHTVQLGPTFDAFDGTQSLAGVQVVYLQANNNWTVPDMPAAGQTAIRNFVNGGGGLVTSEWVIWKWTVGGAFLTLATTFAVMPTAPYVTLGAATYNQVTADAVINAGLASSITVPQDSFAGTETELVAAEGATTFYSSSTWAGLVGGHSGVGRVLHFSSTMGPSSVGDPNGGRLLSNAVTWAAAGGGCAGDYDRNGRVEPADINVFVNVWFSSVQQGTLAGDFDGNGHIEPADIALFVQTWFASIAAGC